VAPTLGTTHNKPKRPSGPISRPASPSAHNPDLISLRTHSTIFESPMSQPVHEAIDMAQIQGVETRTGASPLRCHGSPISFTDTMSRSPTSARAKPPTARRIRICRWVRTTLLHVLATGWRRGQKDDRELERRRRRYSHLCESPFYVPCLYAHSSRGKRLVYSLLPSQR